jgi:hypothetical protein
VLTVEAFEPVDRVLCTVAVAVGGATVPPVTVCPCSDRFTAPDRWEPADAVETEDKLEARPASAAACPNAPAGAATRTNAIRPPNITLVLSIELLSTTL